MAEWRRLNFDSVDSVNRWLQTYTTNMKEPKPFYVVMEPKPEGGYALVVGYLA